MQTISNGGEQMTTNARSRHRSPRAAPQGSRRKKQLDQSCFMVTNVAL